MKKKYILLFLTVVATLLFFFTEAEWGEEKKETATVPPVVKKNTVQAQKNEPETVKTTTTGKHIVADKKNVRPDKNGLKKDVSWVCPECGAPAKPDSLCSYCGEPYTRLWGYGFTRCWKTANGYIWETETAPVCGCLPDETCDFCHDKINHGWKSSGEVRYYEYSDFLKEKGLPMYEAVHPDKPVKKCKKQVVKKMEETVKVQEAKDVQDKNGQNVQQSAGSETEAGKKTGELENVDNCSGDNNGCGTADDLDNVAENLQED